MKKIVTSLIVIASCGILHAGQRQETREQVKQESFQWVYLAGILRQLPKIQQARALNFAEQFTPELRLGAIRDILNAYPDVYQCFTIDRDDSNNVIYVWE